MKETTNIKKERLSNFELMRIVSMFMIVIWHVILHSSIKEYTLGATNFTVWVIYIVFCIHVDSFLLLTGYFQYDKEFKIKKVWNLFSRAWFYKVLFVCLFTILGIETLTSVQFVDEILPLSKINDYWFINLYLVLYILSPFINLLIKNMDQKMHRNLILILILLFSIIPFLSKNMFINQSGYSISHFIVMYIIGAYLHKYPIKDSYYFKNFTRKKRQIIFLSLTIFFALLNVLLYTFSQVLLTFKNPFLLELETMITTFRNLYNSPIVILQAICYLLFFETLNIKSKFINYVSALTLGIYMVHENHHVYNFIYHYIGFDSLENMMSSTLIIKIFVLGAIIFIVSAIIEIITQNIFKLFGKMKFLNNIKSSIVNYFYELQNSRKNT